MKIHCCMTAYAIKSFFRRNSGIFDVQRQQKKINKNLHYFNRIEFLFNNLMRFKDYCFHNKAKYALLKIYLMQIIIVYSERILKFDIRVFMKVQNLA